MQKFFSVYLICVYDMISFCELFEENKKLSFIENKFSLLFILSLVLKIKNSFIFYKIKINIFFLYFININIGFIFIL